MKIWKRSGSLCVLGLCLAVAACGGRSTDPGDGGHDAGQDGYVEPALTVYDIQDPSSEKHPGHDSDVTVKGVVVTTPMTIGDSQDSTGPDSFWVSETAGGPYAGIFVIGVEAFSLPEVVPGDLVDIQGTYKEEADAILSWGNGVIIADSITRTGTGQMPAPEVVTVADIHTGAANAEMYEGCLVRVMGATVSNPSDNHGGFYVKDTGSDDELLISPRFDDNYRYEASANDAFQSVTGVLEYSYDNFRMQPRWCDDLVDDQGEPVCEETTCPTAPVTIYQIQNPDDPDYVPEACTVTVENVVVTSPVFDISGTEAFFAGDPAGGPWSGLMVYARDADASGLTLGDGVTIEGDVKEAYGMTEIVASAITNLGAGTLPDPSVVVPGDVRTDGALAESYEAVLVRVEDVIVRQAAVMGTDGNDHGDFSVAAMAAPDDELIVGWAFEHDYACPPGTPVEVCTDDARSAGDRFNFIAGILDYSYDEFRVQPRTATDMEKRAVDPNDLDGDGHPNATDNCPDDFNPNQENADTDLIGDICDNCPDHDNDDQMDDDGDEVGSVCDNCVLVENPDQADLDDDGLGDVCDLDRDGDLIPEGDGTNPCTGGATADCDDNCPWTPNPDQTDDNSDGVGDLCAGSRHVLLSEISVKPGGHEFVEIHNPSTASVDLSDTYIWDATSHPDTEYWLIATLSSVHSTDFVVKFPDGTHIGAGEFLTVSVSATGDFAAAFGQNPDFAVLADGSGGTQNMEQVFVGGSAGLSNSGEVVVLFSWDGASDLVTDIDYVVWGDKVEACDKTGVTVGAGTYLPDTPVDQQDSLPEHAVAESFQRADMDEGQEKSQGGNGVAGHDETSEDLSQTWTVAAPTPGAPTE